jgi:hypothetical protein
MGARTPPGRRKVERMLCCMGHVFMVGLFRGLFRVGILGHRTLHWVPTAARTQVQHQGWRPESEVRPTGLKPRCGQAGPFWRFLGKDLLPCVLQLLEAPSLLRPQPHPPSSKLALQDLQVPLFLSLLFSDLTLLPFSPQGRCNDVGHVANPGWSPWSLTSPHL